MRFVHHRMGQAKRHCQKRRRLQRQVKPQNHAGMHIDRNCQGGPAQGTAGHGINYGDISLGMIDLNDTQRMLRCEGAGCSQVTAFGFVLTLPLCHELRLVVSLQPTSQTTDRGWGQP